MGSFVHLVLAKILCNLVEEMQLFSFFHLKWRHGSKVVVRESLPASIKIQFFNFSSQHDAVPNSGSLLQGIFATQSYTSQHVQSLQATSCAYYHHYTFITNSLEQNSPKSPCPLLILAEEPELPPSSQGRKAETQRVQLWGKECMMYTLTLLMDA